MEPGMDALQISGKWYISSRRAAKEYGYHADYIGQLIRSGKIKGQKVGRAWYVAADSLSSYLGSGSYLEETTASQRRSRKTASESSMRDDTVKEGRIQDDLPAPAEVIETAVIPQDEDALPTQEEPRISLIPLQESSLQESVEDTQSESIETVEPKKEKNFDESARERSVALLKYLPDEEDALLPKLLRRQKVEDRTETFQVRENNSVNQASPLVSEEKLLPQQRLSRAKGRRAMGKRQLLILAIGGVILFLVTLVISITTITPMTFSM